MRTLHALATLGLAAGLLAPAAAGAQVTPEQLASALPLRGLGPAFMGGRIADVEVHPRDASTWYVGVGSGGVWHGSPAAPAERVGAAE
jgi:hypothetical protein